MVRGRSCFISALLHEYTADFGKEVAVDVEGKSSGDIATRLQELVKAGDSMPRWV